ncbi:MAG: aldose 1-epimerase [Pirellulales bacterium]|nr:aldose 1-epimerase [Pirellulales bacterium]
MRRWIAFLMIGLSGIHLSAGEVTVVRESDSGWEVFTLQQGATIVRVVPAAGANAYSIVHRGIEFFRIPGELVKLPGVGYGNPILYPMPNRVGDAKFTFEGKTYKFPANQNSNFLHGLVHSEAFKIDSYAAKDHAAELTCSLQFIPGFRPYELFPFRHVFRVTISVRDGTVRWTYEVDNTGGDRNLPFGVGFHPFIIYQKSREKTYLQVPASHLMESVHQLPTGNLLDLDGHPLDARQPRSLHGYHADDVFFGMTPDKPARVIFRDANRSITFWASAEFTHLVVWTPDHPYFGIENQTCATNAHNLALQGKQDVAHLQICPPGEKKTGWIEYCFELAVE